MYQINEYWSEFYEELDPDRRRDLYQAVIKEHEDDGANAFREELMDLRYTDPKNSARKVDNFVWYMVILPGYMRPMYLVRALGEGEIRGIVRDLGLENAGKWDETKRAAAYWEYRNAAQRYLDTCSGPAYAKKLFGTITSNDEEKLMRTARDFYKMTVTVPVKYGKEKELELFIRALKDAFFAFSPDAVRAWNTVGAGKREKKRFIAL